MAASRMKLTKTSLARIAPVEGKQLLVWDTELRGFGLRVSAGGAKSYILQRRIGSKERRITIGRADDLTPETARRLATKMAVEFSEGIDPVQKRRKEQARAVTLREAFEAYITAPKKKGGGRGGAKKASTVADIRKAMRRFEDWLDTPVTEISGAMVRDHHRKMADTSGAQANLAHRYLRAAINHMLADADEDDEPIIKHNPVNRLNRLNQWAEVKRRDRRIPSDQMGAWVKAVQTGLIGLQQDNDKRDLLLFLTLTGCRIGEALGDRHGKEPLRWSEVDLKRQTVTFLNTKSGVDLCLPIGAQLAHMLTERHKMRGSDYVFADRHGNVPSDLRSAFARIAAQTEISITAHTLRNTFISTAENTLRIPGALVRKITNHAENPADAHSGYLVFEEGDMRRAMQEIEDWVLSPARLADGDNVVQLNEARV